MSGSVAIERNQAIAEDLVGRLNGNASAKRCRARVTDAGASLA